MRSDAARKASKEWYDRNPEYKLLQDARHRAKKLGLECNITIEDVAVPARCPVLDIELRFEKKARTGNSPSIDRIDNTKGYVKGNTRIISWRANRLKQDATLEEIVRTALYVATHERYKQQGELK